MSFPRWCLISSAWLTWFRHRREWCVCLWGVLQSSGCGSCLLLDPGLEQGLLLRLATAGREVVVQPATVDLDILLQEDTEDDSIHLEPKKVHTMISRLHYPTHRVSVHLSGGGICVKVITVLYYSMHYVSERQKELNILPPSLPPHFNLVSMLIQPSIHSFYSNLCSIFIGVTIDTSRNTRESLKAEASSWKVGSICMQRQNLTTDLKLFFLTSFRQVL